MLELVQVPAGHAYLYGSGAYQSAARVLLAGGEMERAERLARIPLGPAERSGVRDATAAACHVLALCARERGDLDEAERLLARGLAAAGDDGVKAERRELHTALAGLVRGADADEHARAAERLVEEIAASVGDESLASPFREAARAELAAASGR
jgi:hypothetical protein